MTLTVSSRAASITMSAPHFSAAARRDDLRPGLRTLGFRRRVTILFEVADDTVNIIGVYYGGQDYEANFQDDDAPEH